MALTESLRIIVADDEAVIRMGLKTMLSALDHKVIATARNGQEAIDKVKQFEPDMLLLDVKMPQMDGLAAAQIIADEHPLPIVMLTAYSQRAMVEKAINASVMGYLVKPVDENKLGPSISVAVTRYQEMQHTAIEADQLRRRLKGRELIDAAKRELMKLGLSEDEAYHRLQSDARRRQISITDMARHVINHHL